MRFRSPVRQPIRLGVLTSPRSAVPFTEHLRACRAALRPESGNSPGRIRIFSQSIKGSREAQRWIGTDLLGVRLRSFWGF